MRLQISTSADSGYKKKDRVVCKIAKDEWYTGTVIKAGAKLNVEFDDDAYHATIGPEDFKHVKRILNGRIITRSVSDAEAKALYTATKPLKKAIKKTDPETGWILSIANFNGMWNYYVRDKAISPRLMFATSFKFKTPEDAMRTALPLVREGMFTLHVAPPGKKEYVIKKKVAHQDANEALKRLLKK